MQYPPPTPLHSTTDPDLLTQLREMLDGSATAGSAWGKIGQPIRLKGVF